MRHFQTLIVSVILSLIAVTQASNNLVPGAPNFVNLFPDGSLFATPEMLRIAASLRQDVVNMGGCNVNVCFALDGSASIPADEYQLVVEFVQLVTAIMSGTGLNAFAGTQYGLGNKDISRLTSDADAFLLALEGLESPRASRTFIAAGLGFCIRDLRRRLEDANKIVLFGDGRSNFGGNPVPIAERFREMYDGDICAIGIGFQDITVLEQITGSPDRVLAIDDVFVLLDIVGQIVFEVCGFETR